MLFTFGIRYTFISGGTQFGTGGRILGNVHKRTVLSDEGILNVINVRRLHHDAVHQKRLPHPLPDGFGILRAELVVPGILSG